MENVNVYQIFFSLTNSEDVQLLRENHHVSIHSRLLRNIAIICTTVSEIYCCLFRKTLYFFIWRHTHITTYFSGKHDDQRD